MITKELSSLGFVAPHLMGAIEFQGKKYITSKMLHDEVKPTARVSEMNRAIRDMPTYETLVREGHIVEADAKYAKTLEGAELAPLIKSGGYQPVMLIDPVAQKEIEHHFRVSVNQAVQSSRENAVLGVAGINLELLAQDPHTMLLLQAISKTKELEVEQKRLKEEQLEQRLQLLEIKKSQEHLVSTQGHAQYFSVMGYAASKNIRVNLASATAIGKMASRSCKEAGVQTGEVPDQRYGRVRTYPSEILAQAFEEYFSEE